MKNTMKRLLCLLLALVMCAGLAVGAVADGEEPTPPEGGDGNDTPVYATGITLNKSSLEMFVDDEETLTATVTPSGYNQGTVEWESSDDDVATVDDGDVTAVSAGSATITAKITGRDGEELKATCSVTVKANPTVQSLEIRPGGSKTMEVDDTLELHVWAKYSDGAEEEITDATWFSSKTAVATVDAGLVTAVGAGEATITATLDGSNKEATLNITVTAPDTPSEPTIEISGATFSNGKYTLSMSVGNTVTLNAALNPASSSGSNTITWRSSDPSVATVGNSTGLVTAVKEGTTEITATASGSGLSATVEVTVSPASSISVSAITASTVKTKNLAFGSDTSSIYGLLRSRYNSKFSKTPTDNAKIVFSSISGSTVGTLYERSSSSTTVKADSTSTYTLSALKNFSFRPSAKGTYELNYTLTENGKSITGKITITVKDATADITITLSDDSKAYTFSTNSNVEKTKGTSLISNAISTASGQTYSTIKFGTPSTASKRVGTLYANSNEKALGTSKYASSNIGNLYFVPRDEGTYSISYTAYDADGGELCYGSLIIEVGVTNDTTVTVTLDNDSPYTFSKKTKKDNISAAAAIDDMITDEFGTYSYIRFGSVVSGSNVGTLYADDDKTKLNTSTQFKPSANAVNSISDLYFVPEKSGTYVSSFTAYNSSGSKWLDGTLKIVVPSESSSDMDIYFNTTTGSSVSLGEDVFESWFRQQKGSNYKLAYVTFDDVSRSFGSFKHSSSSFTPGNDVRYYTEGYTGSVGSSAKYIDNVKYTAPGSVGSISVDFTCYGGTNASSSGTRVSGSFRIFVTKSSVKGITCDVKSGSNVILKESDFSTVHKNAMSLSSSTSAKFYIELLEIPSKGTLYYNYASSSRPGTKLTGSNFDNYEFYVNSSSSYDSVADLTYVPDASTTGSASVRYLARSTDGDPMYVGSVTFSRGKDQSASISCGADGYTFKASDFYSSSDKDPVAYVIFGQPSSGELMINYTNGRGVPIDSSVRLYTVSYTSGAYALSSLSYIPKAGFSGNATVDYTAVTQSGKAQSGTLTIAVSGKKGSSHFKDVTSTGTGAWASDAIDFAYKWGLVNGTGVDTFSPDETMTRAMLVTILYRAAGTPKVSGTCRFSDVPAGTYYYDAVIWAADNGIVTGTSATTFSPNRAVNREQVAAFLHRYAKYNGEDVSVKGTLNGYVDKSYVSSYAIEPMSWAVQHGYITSNSGTELVLSPGSNATRAQVAVMLHRFLTY